MQFVYNSLNDSLWMEQDVHQQMQKQSIEQDMYWAQRAHKNWVLLGDKNNNFQTMATRQTCRISRRNVKNWFLDQFGILQVINSKFYRRFKRDPNKSPRRSSSFKRCNRDRQQYSNQGSIKWRNYPNCKAN